MRKAIGKISRIVLCAAMIATIFVAVAVNVGTETRCLPPPPGMVGWWPLDGNTNDIVDENHGTQHGGAIFASGFVDQAISLDGLDDYADFGANVGNFRTNDFTIDLWVSFRTTGPEQIMIEKYVETFEPDRQGWTFTKMPGNMHIRLHPTGGPTLDVFPSPIATNTWYHAALTRSGDLFTIYWNGVALGAGIFPERDFNTDATLKIGHRGNPIDTPGSKDWRGFYLNGLIDEVEIFDGALSSSEIQAIFNAGSKGKCKKICATIDIDPDTLNLKSKGKWITAYIELPEGYDVYDIDIDTVKLHYNDSSADAEWGDIQGIVYMVKFDRDSVKEILNGVTGDVELKLTGEIASTAFEGKDTIRVINE